MTTQKQNNKSAIVAAFQTWDGGRSVSGFHTEDVWDFIQDSKSSFATLHTFNCITEAEKAYNSALDRAEWLNS